MNDIDDKLEALLQEIESLGDDPSATGPIAAADADAA
jgi:hypothetical protein